MTVGEGHARTGELAHDVRHHWPRAVRRRVGRIDGVPALVVAQDEDKVGWRGCDRRAVAAEEPEQAAKGCETDKTLSSLRHGHAPVIRHGGLLTWWMSAYHQNRWSW